MLAAAAGRLRATRAGSQREGRGGAAWAWYGAGPGGMQVLAGYG